MLPTKFRIIWPSGFRGEEFQKSAKAVSEEKNFKNQPIKNKNRLWAVLYKEY
jgi:predicted GIY-YIG superfamily endonuclease